MNRNLFNKSTTNLHQRPNKSNKKIHINKSKENNNRNQIRNRLKQFNKSEIIKNASNSNLRAKSNKKNFGIKDKNMNSIIPNSMKMNSNKSLNNLSSSNSSLQNIKSYKNNENISDNIIPSINTIPNKNYIQINLTNKPLVNTNITSFNSNNKNNNIKNRFHSDINNPNFLNPKKQKILVKTELKQITKRFNIKGNEITIPNFENLKYISLEDTDALFNAWQNCSIIYKIFEEKIMKKNNFEINKNTLELITKNSEACEQLTEQKFWILYIEYLINNNLLINEKQFLSVINEAFSYMTYNCTQLRIYYLQKIKKYAPIYLSDGTFDDSDETYINKLNESTINFIKKQKGVISSNVKLKSANKNKIFKLENNLENKENMKNNKIKCLIGNGGKI